MCIVDYHTAEQSLYSRISAFSPKFKHQLLQFRAYESFKYYDYQVPRKIGNNVLRHKFCDLLGPYALILTHMAINHNPHIGLKMCAYCNRKELKKHFDENSLEQCYTAYLQHHEIELDDAVCNIVTEFYEMLKNLSLKLKICTVRHHTYAAAGHGTVEKLGKSYGRNFPNEITILQQRMQKRNISFQCAALADEFDRIISILYGGNNASRLISQPTAVNNSDPIVISDDDEDDNTGDGYNIGLNQFNAKNEAEFSWEMPVASEVTLDSAGQVVPENLIKCERTLDDQMTSVSSTNLPSGNASWRNDNRASIDSTAAMSTASAQSSWSHRNETEQFGSYVAQRLAKLPNELQRRRLETSIQEVIVKAEKEALE